MENIAVPSEISSATVNNPSPSTKKSKPKRKSTIQAFFKSLEGSKGGDDSLAGTAYEGQNAADILAKQSDMLEQIQHVMIEERWQHEQHSRVLENELQSLHDIIRKHEGNKVTGKFGMALLASKSFPADAKAGDVNAGGGVVVGGPKKAAKAELPELLSMKSMPGLPKKPNNEDALKLAEESKRLANEFKGEARKHLERVKDLQAQVKAEKSAKHLLAEALGSMEASMEFEKAAVTTEKEAKNRYQDGKAVADDRAQRAVQIARQFEELVKSYAQLPTEPAVKMHVQELHAKLYSIDDELGGVLYQKGSSGAELPAALRRMDTAPVAPSSAAPSSGSHGTSLGGASEYDETKPSTIPPSATLGSVTPKVIIRRRKSGKAVTAEEGAAP